MKILHTVEFYYPSVGGAQEVVRQLSERMVKLGHDVTVATTKLPERKDLIINGVKIAEFNISGNTVHGLTGEVDKYKQFLLKSDFDVIMNYAAQQWATDISFDVLDQIKAATILVPCGFSGLYDPMYVNYFKKMPVLLKKYDATVYMSGSYRDISFARQHAVHNTHLIPNGAGSDEFSKLHDVNIRSVLGIPDDHYLILAVGSHTGLKGHAEAIEIFRNAEIKKSTLLIVANNFTTGCSKKCLQQLRISLPNIRLMIQRKKLLIKDLPRTLTVSAYKEADVLLFPSNIEASPLVLYEAMAAGIPFLTTDVGNSKEIIEWSQGGLLLPTSIDEDGMSHANIIESAHLLSRVRQGILGAKLGAKGHKAWERRFTWETITKQYEKLYMDTLK